MGVTPPPSPSPIKGEGISPLLLTVDITNDVRYYRL